MRNVLVLSMAVLLVLGGGVAMGGDQKDVVAHPECPYCGMDRGKFAHSRMLLTYENQTATGFCSLHCAAVEMAMFLDKIPVTIEVADYRTRQLIDAEQAFWVIGGDQAGVMTRHAKWAFEKKGDADQFIKDHGGEPATFEAAAEATYADMYQDNKMIREKRKMMREKMKHQQKKE